MHLFLNIHYFKTFTPNRQWKYSKKKTKLKKILSTNKFYLKIIALLVVLMAAQKFQYCFTVKNNVQTGVYRIFVILWMFYGTDIYIMFYQEGISLYLINSVMWLHSLKTWLCIETAKAAIKETELCIHFIAIWCHYSV